MIGAGSRSPTRLVVAAVLGALVAWVLIGAVLLLQARNAIDVGLDAIGIARSQTAPDDLLDGRPISALEESRDAFRRAERRLAHPLVAPLRVLPVAGRQLRSARALSGAAGDVSDVAYDVVRGARRALRSPHETGPERIALLRRLGRLASDAERRLADVDLGPSKALIAPLADGRAEMAERLDGIREALRDGGTVTTGLADLLQGPRRYLVLAANNAEMRAGSGMFLSAGPLTMENGAFDLGDLMWTGDLYLDDTPPPPVEDPDFAARWGWLNPNKEWRNLGLSPRFEASAQLATRMWAATGGAPVDGVLALDPVAFEGVLRGTGPVEADGRTLSADDVVPFLLHDQYLSLGATGDDLALAQAARREQLGGIADAALGAVGAGRFDIGKLGAGLAEAARGRHLLAWSSDPDEQRMWQAAGVAGEVSQPSLLVSVLNRGGNKLDQFLHVGAELSFRDDAKRTAATLTVTLDNRAPTGRPRYIEGPFPTSGVTAGDYKGLLAVTLPGFAADMVVEGFDTYSALGVDGPTRVVAVPVVVGRGRSQTFTVRFTLPAGSGRIRIEPSARVPAVEWEVDGESFRDRRARTVPWG